MTEPEEKLGAYVLTRQLGEGGMARIYLARHEKLGRVVAIKRLHADHFDDPITVHRFLAEARAVGDLRHPNLVAVYDVVEEPGEIYLVMEYLKGRDVARAMREDGPFAPARAAVIAAQICDGLAAVHARQIVHRDLKPENVFLLAGEGDEAVKLLDFGVARLAESRPKELRTRSGLTVGTPTYMSPEQATASPVDGRSDLYAVGILLFEMITGKPPFVGGYGDVMLQHVHDPPRRLAQARPDVPPWLDELVMRCLDKEPDRRHQSAAELAAALRAGLAGSLPSKQRRQIGRWVALGVASVLAGAGVGLVVLRLLAGRAAPEGEEVAARAAMVDGSPAAVDGAVATEKPLAPPRDLGPLVETLPAIEAPVDGGRGRGRKKATLPPRPGGRDDTIDPFREGGGKKR